MSLGLDPTVAQIRQAIQRLERRAGMVGTVVLRAGTTSTVIENPAIGHAATVTLTPASASAAAETGVFVEVERGRFTIRHTSKTDTTRTFRYAVHT